MAIQKDSLSKRLSDPAVYGSTTELTAEGDILLNFLMLIVDIKYRNKYGKTLEAQELEAYSEKVPFNKVLADQVSPVDDGLLGM